MKFEKYDFLSPQEEIESRVLSFLQRQHFENLLRDCVNEQLGLSSADDGFLIRHEFMLGCS